jgi:hypothetical protein
MSVFVAKYFSFEKTATSHASLHDQHIAAVASKLTSSMQGQDT